MPVPRGHAQLLPDREAEHPLLREVLFLNNLIQELFARLNRRSLDFYRLLCRSGEDLPDPQV